jgi:hypothetical protein
VVTAVVYSDAIAQRRLVESAGNGETHWRSDYMGMRGKASAEPEAFLIEMSPNETLLPHFHAVDQFQVFVEGAGILGRQPTSTLTVHYADHHTAYGPIIAGPYGFSYFTFRPTTDPGAVYLNKPGHREALRASQKRHATAANLPLSTGPVLATWKEVVVEPLLPELGAEDGLGAAVMRLGAGMSMRGTDPSKTGGQYYLVVNGNVEFDSRIYPRWSVLFVQRDDKAFEFQAGPLGAEVLVLGFTRR